MNEHQPDHSPPSTMADELLFNVSNDDLLISVYQKQGRTLDDLPYTDEFEQIYAAIVGDVDGDNAGDGASDISTSETRNKPVNRTDLFHRLHNLRKAGKLPRLGRAVSERPHIDTEQEAMLQRIVEQAIEKISLRDQLLYTDTFDEIVVKFNAEAGLNLSAHDVWRIVAKLAK